MAWRRLSLLGCHRGAWETYFSRHRLDRHGERAYEITWRTPDGKQHWQRVHGDIDDAKDALASKRPERKRPVVPNHLEPPLLPRLAHVSRHEHMFARPDDELRPLLLG